MWTRKELKNKARQKYAANYWKSVLVVLILVLIEGGVVSYNFNNSDLKKVLKGGNINIVESMKDDIKDARNDIKDARNDIEDAKKDMEEAYQEILDAKEEVEDEFNVHVIVPFLDVDKLFGDSDAIIEKGEVLIDDFENNYQKYLPALIGVIAFAAVIAILAGLIAVGVRIFLLNPIYTGGVKFLIENPGEEAVFGRLGDAFKGSHYKNIVKVMFLRDLFTFLWCLLFYIPGVIKAYEYMMIPYLMAEHPEMSADEAFETSKRMMNGNKWAAFVLDLSFIGWRILNALTFGILGVFFVNPYRYQTGAELYLALKEADQKGSTTYENYVEVE